MANKSKKQNLKGTKKQNNSLILVAAAAVIVCMAVVFVVKGKSEEQPAAQSGERQLESTAVIASGESLDIPLEEITEEASFFPVEVDGTSMEIIAVRDSEGEIRTAFNTCQVCYGSGRGYYEQSGDYLVCQNCGNRFSMDEVGIESGGCNPWPIFEDDRTVSDDTVSISYDFLSASKEIFANWKIKY